MRIGVIVDNELFGDIRVLREAGILKETGHELFILCFDFGKSYDDQVSGFAIRRIRLKKKLKDTLFFFQNTIPAYEWLWTAEISRLIVDNDLEALHVHDLYMARAARRGIMKSGRNIPLILDLHENYAFTVTTYNWTKGFFRNLLSGPGLWKKKEREYLSYADTIIVLSEAFRVDLAGEYPELTKERFALFPNVPDLSRPEYQKKNKVEGLFTNDHPVLFYYGIIAERRGIFDTLDVFSRLVQENIGVNLLLIGPVDKMDKARFLQLMNRVPGDRIRYIPWINSQEFPGYLEASDICLAPFKKNPQHESGVANKIYDYMLGGKALVVSDCRPQQELVEKHSCGLAFSGPQEFHDAILKLLNDPALRKAMGEKGRKAILEKYNAEHFRHNLTGIYCRS